MKTRKKGLFSSELGSDSFDNEKSNIDEDSNFIEFNENGIEIEENLN